jgi:hypothetical protein
MEILVQNKMDPFWDDRYKHLDYAYEPFNDPEAVNQWLTQGYPGKFTGMLCDMRKMQPSWNHRITEYFEKEHGFIGAATSYYKMTSGTVMPNHSDKFKRYIELFNLEGQEHRIYRALVMLEDWKSGHYLEVGGTPIVKWKAGTYFIWNNDMPHLAANLGLEDRYTLQVTGHI